MMRTTAESQSGYHPLRNLVLVEILSLLLMCRSHKEDAVKALLQSVHHYPCNWAAWQVPAAVCLPAAYINPASPQLVPLGSQKTTVADKQPVMASVLVDSWAPTCRRCSSWWRRGTAWQSCPCHSTGCATSSWRHYVSRSSSTRRLLRGWRCPPYDRFNVIVMPSFRRSCLFCMLSQSASAEPRARTE